MALAIGKARKKGIGDIHLHCRKGNAVSARMIVGNGGVLDSGIEVGKPPEAIQHYVVTP